MRMRCKVPLTNTPLPLFLLNSASDRADPIAQWTYFNISHFNKPTQKILWLDLTFFQLVLCFSISVRLKLLERTVSCFPSSLPHLLHFLTSYSPSGKCLFLATPYSTWYLSSQTRDQTFTLHSGSGPPQKSLSSMYFYWSIVNLLGGAHIGGIQLNELS